MSFRHVHLRNFEGGLTSVNYVRAYLQPRFICCGHPNFDSGFEWVLNVVCYNGEIKAFPGEENAAHISLIFNKTIDEIKAAFESVAIKTFTAVDGLYSSEKLVSHAL